MNQAIYIEQKRLDVFNRDGWFCRVCNRPLQMGVPQVAHCIAQTESNEKEIKAKVFQWFQVFLTNKQIGMIIHHEFNLKSTCSENCNSKCNMGFKRKQANELIMKIIQNLCDTDESFRKVIYG